ncbi:PTS sugar transporter subunit IIA [Rhizobium grahamii]|uniref:PTS transporter subunit IIA-like nitrogen-regulatory protein PtsN n=2 Tax=Rhizobium grahamii TaxID=1120045 RepID=S3I5A8_9HYPH|nr:PTS sugar transporter subunit IIA [Rhizobium grahamii]EPE94728.1 PTS transporter subunit IIA-like nitrogen-regulatory protein PtsN [Rhizobium grahamii CCGE 502]RDJ05528.1 transcriptional regulator [Rhizobium grahamii]
MAVCLDIIPEEIVINLPGGDRASALHHLATVLSREVRVPTQTISSALLGRERMGSTAIGGGVAVPHALLTDIAEPAKCLAILKHPIWFDAPDSEPVSVLLALLWPTSHENSYLPSLAGLMRRLRDPKLREALAAAQSVEEAALALSVSSDREITKNYANPLSYL